MHVVGWSPAIKDLYIGTAYAAERHGYDCIIRARRRHWRLDDLKQAWGFDARLASSLVPLSYVPEMPVLGMKIEMSARWWVVCNEVEIELNPQPWCGRKVEISVDDFRQTGSGLLHILVGEIVEVLLDLEVRRTCGEVEISSGKDLAGYVVRSHKHIMGFRSGGEFSCLQNSTEVADVWLDDVNGLSLGQLAKLNAIMDSLARGYRQVHVRRDLCQ